MARECFIKKDVSECLTLKELAKIKGYSISGLALKLGMDRKNLDRYNSGACYPRLDIAWDISKALNITINELCEILIER